MKNRIFVFVILFTEMLACKLLAQCNPESILGFQGITQTAANVLISSNSAGTNYLEYGLQGFIPGTGSMPGVGGTLVAVPANISLVNIFPLLPGTGYSICTRKNCNGSWSSNSFSGLFTTAAFVINTVPITPTGFCAGTTLSVSFTANVNANPGNIYTAELSDATGSFSMPDVIGYINSSATSGIISAVIPITPFIGGSGYRIRVTSSSPISSTANNNGTNISISAPIGFGGAITSTTGGFFCGGGLKTFTVSSIQNATSYIWSAPQGAVISSGQGTQSCSILFPATGTTGSITVYGSNANCVGSVESFPIQSNPYPPTPVAVNVTGCNGTPISLMLANPNPMLSFSVADPYTGPSTTYTCTISDAFGFCSSTSAPAFITVNPLPAANITASGSTTFCSGGSVTLNAPVAANRSYQWLKGTNNISAANMASYNATIGGKYKVIVTNLTTGCTRSTVNPTTVTVLALPQATITATGPTVFCAGDSVQFSANSGVGLSYQWMKGLNAIPGATQLNYNATTTGNYKVIVTNLNNCSKTSAKKVVTVNCREDIDERSSLINIYPNPTEGPVTVVIISNENNESHYTVTDLTGREIFSEQIFLSEGENKFEVDMTKLPSGIYLLKINAIHCEAFRKIIKQ